MGEEAKEQVKTEAKPEEKADEKKEEKKEEKKPEEEEKKGEPKPPSFLLFVDLHCVGCTKKIERSIMKIRGVERVVIDMVQNQVTIKGIVEPQTVCNKIMKKTKRRAQVLSPPPEAEGQTMPELVFSQVSGPTTVELNVDMHCEACAEQIKRMILKMRGVQTATTELSTGKVTVTGTMEANKLVDYVYRRTRKQAKIVPQPEPKLEKKTEEKPRDGEEKPDEEKTEGEGKPPEETKKEEGEKDSNSPEKKENTDNEWKKELVGEEIVNIYNFDEDNMKRMVYYYQPPYVIERFPPPQLFSDENPNACSIC